MERGLNLSGEPVSEFAADGRGKNSPLEDEILLPAVLLPKSTSPFFIPLEDSLTY